MSARSSYATRAAAAAIAKGHSVPAALRELLIWTTDRTTAPEVEAYFGRHLDDANLLNELFAIAREGEDAGDAPWAAANLIAEFPAALLSSHREELVALAQFEWDFLRQPAQKALTKIGEK